MTTVRPPNSPPPRIIRSEFITNLIGTGGEIVNVNAGRGCPVSPIQENTTTMTTDPNAIREESRQLRERLHTLNQEKHDANIQKIRAETEGLRAKLAQHQVQAIRDESAGYRARISTLEREIDQAKTKQLETELGLRFY